MSRCLCYKMSNEWHLIRYMITESITRSTFWTRFIEFFEPKPHKRCNAEQTSVCRICIWRTNSLLAQHKPRQRRNEYNPVNMSRIVFSSPKALRAFNQNKNNSQMKKTRVDGAIHHVLTLSNFDRQSRAMVRYGFICTLLMNTGIVQQSTRFSLIYRGPPRAWMSPLPLSPKWIEKVLKTLKDPPTSRCSYHQSWMQSPHRTWIHPYRGFA